jgi:hypothetical protein
MRRRRAMRLPMLTPRLLASGFLAATLSVGSANGFAKDTGVIYVAHGVGEDITVVDLKGKKSPVAIPVGRIPRGIVIDD